MELISGIAGLHKGEELMDQKSWIGRLKLFTSLAVAIQQILEWK